jgi:hypothetical protein
MSTGIRPSTVVRRRGHGDGPSPQTARDPTLTNAETEAGVSAGLFSNPKTSGLSLSQDFVSNAHPLLLVQPVFCTKTNALIYLAHASAQHDIDCIEFSDNEVVANESSSFSFIRATGQYVFISYGSRLPCESSILTPFPLFSIYTGMRKNRLLRGYVIVGRMADHPADAELTWI